MSTEAFQRARRPEQKEKRRLAILEATASLIDELGVDGVTLTAISKRSGLAKSNLYRYFESREDILLQLLTDDETRWVSDLEGRLARVEKRGDCDAVGAAIAASLVAAPRLCLLTTILTTVLEQNVSLEVASTFKTRVGDLSIRIGNAMHVAMPAIALERLPDLQRYVHALVAGLWPIAHPAPVIEKLLAQPEYSHFASDFETDLREAVTAMLRGLQESSS